MLNANKITFIDFKVQSSNMLLQSVEIVNYKVPLIAEKEFSGGTVSSEEIAKMRPVGGFSEDGEMGSNDTFVVDGYKASTNITSIEYKIDIPYSIPSDGKDYSVKIKMSNFL